MPRCSVLSCGRRRDKYNPRLTLHILPKKKLLRQKWIDIIGSKNINLNLKKINVCSLHFEESCFYKTLNKTRLQDNTVPSLHLQPETPKFVDVNRSNTENISIEDTEMVCRICLSIINKLFCIRRYNLTDAFEQLTGQKLNFDDGLPDNLCAECATKIHNFYKFRKSIQKSYCYMLRMQVENINLTETLFKNIDRKDIEEIGLNTLKKTLKIDEYDLDIKHTDLCEEVQTKYETEIRSDNEPEEYSDVEKTIINNDVSNLDSKNIEEINDVDTKVSEKISDVDNEISDKLSDLVNENNGFNNEIIDETDNVDLDNDGLPLVEKELVKKPKVPSNQNRELDEELFTCSDQTYEEQIKDLEKRKKRKKYQQGLFKCTICYTGFNKQKSYDQHMFRHTDAAGEYECTICKIHFRNNSQLVGHKSHYHNKRKIFSCNQCGYVTKIRRVAKRHQEWHEGKKYVCPYCKEPFAKYSAYIGHVRIQHPSKYICQLCGYTFVNEKGLGVHKLRAHTEDNIVVTEDGPVCEPCNVKFATEEAYQKHRSISHADNSKRKERNERTFSYKSHNRPRVVKVKVRNKNGTVVAYREVPKVEWPIPCEQCGILLGNSHTYNGHFRRMHPDKNRTQYTGVRKRLMCEVCGKTFQGYAALRAHRLIHADVRSFKCDYCDKEFTLKINLMAHIRLHSANPPSYGCVVCGKQFTNISNRKRHMMEAEMKHRCTSYRKKEE